MRKILVLAFYILWFIGPQKALASDVKVDKYREEDKLQGFSQLPKGTCTEIVNNSNECNFYKDTTVKWGAGFCENTKEEINNRIKKSSPLLLINGIPVEKLLITESHEFYQRDKYQYCYSWLVKLSQWSPGSLVTLETYNHNILLYKSTIKVLRNGT